MGISRNDADYNNISNVTLADPVLRLICKVCETEFPDAEHLENHKQVLY